MEQDPDATLVADIRRRTRLLLRGAGVDPAHLGVAVRHDGPRLTVELAGCPSSTPQRQAIVVRVLDAVAAGVRTYGDVNVIFLDHPVCEETTEPSWGRRPAASH